MATYFKCKSCHDEHRSPAGFMTVLAFKASPMSETQFMCHQTGTTASYGKTDMYWRDDSDVLAL